MKTNKPNNQRSPRIETARLREVKPLTNGVESMKGYAPPRMKWTEHRGPQGDRR
jgi:hypothetical protein